MYFSKEITDDTSANYVFSHDILALSIRFLGQFEAMVSIYFNKVTKFIKVSRTIYCIFFLSLTYNGVIDALG